MALLSWNVCGFNNDERINEVSSLLVAKRIDITGLYEMKIKERRQLDVRGKLLAGWEFVTNMGTMGPREGDSVWVGWDTTV